MPKYQLATFLMLPLAGILVFHGNAYALSILSFALIYGVLSMATSLCMGHAGQVTLAQAGFFAVGAYTSGILATTVHLPFGITLIAAIIVSTATGYLLGYPISRVKGHLLGLFTLAFTQVVSELAFHWTSVTGGANGLYGIPKLSVPGLDAMTGFLAVLTGYWFLTVVASDNLVNSRFGRAMHLLKASETGAQACGIDVTKFKCDVFAISAGMCGGAGAFYAHFIGYIGAESFSLDVSITVVAMSILGGMTDIRGAIIGSFILTLLSEPLRNYPLYQPIMYAVVMLVVIVGLPQGIVPSMRKLFFAAGRDRRND